MIKGEQVKESYNNMNRINEKSIIEIMGIEKGKTKRFTASEMKDLAKDKFKPRNIDYKVRSTPTLLKYLELNGCEWKKTRPRINGKQVWCYDVTLE